MSDPDFLEYWRTRSPDGSKLLVGYGLDLGAIGTSKSKAAVLNLSDTAKDLSQYTLPATLDRFEWLNNRVILAHFDTIPSIRSGHSERPNNTEINGVKVIVAAYDYIEPNAKLVIEYRELSPNRKHELVAYRYMNDIHNVNFIHISIIPAGKQIPKYGNYLIADMQADYVLDGKWDKNNNLLFYSNTLYSEMIPYYLVHDHPNISYRVINDDKKYGSKYRWLGLKNK